MVPLLSVSGAWECFHQTSPTPALSQSWERAGVGEVRW